MLDVRRRCHCSGRDVTSRRQFRLLSATCQLQSACRTYHSTETAAVLCMADILRAIDNGDLLSYYAALTTPSFCSAYWSHTVSMAMCPSRPGSSTSMGRSSCSTSTDVLYAVPRGLVLAARRVVIVPALLLQSHPTDRQPRSAVMHIHTLLMHVNQSCCRPGSHHCAPGPPRVFVC